MLDKEEFLMHRTQYQISYDIIINIINKEEMKLCSRK